MWTERRVSSLVRTMRLSLLGFDGVVVTGNRAKELQAEIDGVMFRDQHRLRRRVADDGPATGSQARGWFEQVRQQIAVSAGRVAAVRIAPNDHLPRESAGRAASRGSAGRDS